MAESSSGIRELFFGVPGRPGPAGHVLSITELADLIRVHPNTVRAWIEDGDLPAFKAGQAWRISTEKAIEFLESRSNSPHTHRD